MSAGYNLNDFETQKRMLTEIHTLAKAVDAKRREAQGLGALDFEPFKLDYALFRCSRRIARHRGLQNKYVPHQGQRECARRPAA